MNIPTLSEAVCGLLTILSHGAGAGSTLQCQANAGRRIGAPTELPLPTRHKGRVEWIPSALLTALEQDSAPWSASLALQYRGRVSQLCVLAAVFPFVRSYFNPKDPARSTGKRWLWPEDEITAAQLRASTFLLPTQIIDGRCNVTVLWGLETPLDLRSDGARAIDLLQRLATATGAVVPADDVDLASLSIPIPGFGIAGHPVDANRVRCTLLNAGHAYSLEAIDAALRALSTATPAPARRARKQEQAR